MSTMINKKFLHILILEVIYVVTLGTAQNINGISCGPRNYTSNQVREATAEGNALFSSGQTVGANLYPHRFYNSAGLSFNTNGPYQEFPILKNGIYAGGNPGPDRVVFAQRSGAFVGAMTHTGAPGNDFVKCVELRGTNLVGVTAAVIVGGIAYMYFSSGTFTIIIPTLMGAIKGISPAVRLLMVSPGIYTGVWKLAKPVVDVYFMEPMGLSPTWDIIVETWNEVVVENWHQLDPALKVFIIDKVTSFG